VHRGHLCLASPRSTHGSRGTQHRPAHRATHLPMCHFAAHHTQKNTLIEFTVKNPSPGHIERWGGRARRGLSKPIPAVQLDTYAASVAKFGPRWTTSSYPTNLTNCSTSPRPPLPNTRLIFPFLFFYFMFFSNRTHNDGRTRAPSSTHDTPIRGGSQRQVMSGARLPHASQLQQQVSTESPQMP
jgi:hypothetical protein